MGRTPCCAKSVNKGAWTREEDEKLANYMSIHGEGKWRMVAENAGLNRCAKSCRLRWLNYLKPGIKRGNITSDEEDLIIRLHNLLGNRWALIAGRLPGRTDNEIKNYWKTILVKKLEDQTLRAQYTEQQAASQNNKTCKVCEVGKINSPKKKNSSTHLEGFESSEFSKCQDDQEEKIAAINEIEELSDGDLENELTFKQMQEMGACDDGENFRMSNEVDKELPTMDAMESYYLALMENENYNNNNNSEAGGNNFITGCSSSISSETVKVGNESRYGHDDNLYVELQRLASFLDLEDQRKEF